MSGRQSIEPTYDSRETGDAYTVETREGNKRIDKTAVADPLVHTTIHIRGWRSALAVLLGRYQCSVHVDAIDSERIEDIFDLNNDYKGQKGSTRRTEFDAQLERGLHDFAAVAAEHDPDDLHADLPGASSLRARSGDAVNGKEAARDGLGSPARKDPS